MDVRFGLHSGLKSDSNLLNYSAWRRNVFELGCLSPVVLYGGSDK